MSLLGRSSALALALSATALLAVGCGETVIDDAKAEAATEQYLQKTVGQKVSSIDCPSDVEVKAGATFDCAVSLAGGKQETVTLKILNEDADFEVADLQPSK